MDFHEILHFSTFRKYVEKIQALPNPTTIRDTSHEDQSTFVILHRSVLFTV